MWARVLARPYLMTLYVIFPIHMNFPITFRCVLKATIHRKKTVNCFTLLKKVFFFSKRRFHNIAHACCIWLIFPLYRDLLLFFMFLYLSFINYFHHITFHTRDSLSIFIKDFPFSCFPLIY